MINRAQKRFLLYCAEVYTKLGYSIGLANKKKLLEVFELREGINGQRARSSLDAGLLRQWDGISLILDDVVCVDIDVEDVDKVITEELPKTWTEKTARGWHYFYRMPKGRFACRISFRPHLDLLVKDKRIAHRAYGESEDELWYGHALISPTDNYSRVHPSEMMAKALLPMAPSWVVSALYC